MSTFDPDNPSEHVKQVLRLLKKHHNVLIAGSPATGKSRLLAEIRYWFQQTVKPAMRPHEKIPLPAGASITGLEEWLPSPERTERKVCRITFHQGTKYRDFVSGFAPSVSGGNSSFVVTHGPLLSAAEHGKSPNGAALIEVDEINRGPAVTIFGDTIAAIESDKRQLPDGQDGIMTTTFAMLNKDDGTSQPYSLPYHLYIVAAMNEADTSVEPLDVAFLRRFVKYRLTLDEPALRTYFSLQADKQPLLDTPASVADVYEAAVQAWAEVNDKIELARGAAFQLGHGIFMEKPQAELPADVQGALTFASETWARIYAHVEEVFFGDTRGIAAILRGGEGRLYKLEEHYFADTPVVRLRGPKTVGPHNIYAILRAVAGI